MRSVSEWRLNEDRSQTGLSGNGPELPDGFAPKVGRFGDIRISLNRTFLDRLGCGQEVPVQSSAGLPPQGDNRQRTADVGEKHSQNKTVG